MAVAVADTVAEEVVKVADTAEEIEAGIEEVDTEEATEVDGRIKDRYIKRYSGNLTRFPEYGLFAIGITFCYTFLCPGNKVSDLASQRFSL